MSCIDCSSPAPEQAEADPMLKPELAGAAHDGPDVVARGLPTSASDA